jgi:hypothetical protein
MFMDAPFYGSFLEETTQKLSMCFTDCDNQTNEIKIYLYTYSHELPAFTSLVVLALANLLVLVAFIVS